jgi:mono/diheme cytochrome c family protein
MVTNVLLAPQTIPYVPLQQEKALAWDALIKEYSAKTGELSAKFAFSLTNISDTNVTISRVRTSCGCTVAKVPTNIWTVPPGSNGTFEVVADLRGKSGVITKVVTVDTTAGYRFLTLRVSIPATPLTANTLALRARNLQVAMVDRQLVFKGDCAICHLQPAVGKTDEALYRAACGVCHEAEHRASMVPNLHALNRPTDQEYWRNWITKGKPNTLMPAWALPEGGPLLEGQINSLIEYVMGPFKTQPCLDQPPKQAASALPGTVPLPVGAGPSMPAGPAANTNQQPPGAARLPTE